jgi:uroporphyrinogen decarboxylase
MTQRELVKRVLNHETDLPYVPWAFRFTAEPMQELCRHYGCTEDDLIAHTGCHIIELGSAIGFFDNLGNDKYRDVFGVVWDRSIDKDIGLPAGQVITDYDQLDRVEFPDPANDRFFCDIERRIDRHPDKFRLFDVGFSLFERAWSMRSMDELMIDMIEEPEFVHTLLTKIADYNVAHVTEALKYDIDAVIFGDDWGQQSGLIMGYERWKEFIYPQIKRMYSLVRNAGKYQFIHSCGDVDELFDDLIDLGLNCFNPFQPEAMPIDDLHAQYKDRLTFWGGLSTQQTLPYKGIPEVRGESEKLLQMGRQGGFIFSPAHAVESDVPFDNILSFIDVVHSQRGAIVS